MPVNSANELAALAKRTTGRHHHRHHRARRHLPSRARAVPGGRRREIQARALSRRGAGGDRPARRPGATGSSATCRPHRRKSRRASSRRSAATSQERSESSRSADLRRAGFPDTVANQWYGMLAPAHTPPAVIAKLNAAFMPRSTIRSEQQAGAGRRHAVCRTRRRSSPATSAGNRALGQVGPREGHQGRIETRRRIGHRALRGARARARNEPNPPVNPFAAAGATKVRDLNWRVS